MSCFAEVASQFSEPGGAYLYVRTAFGRFAGMQISWFDLLNMIATIAALSNLFADYLATFFPSTQSTWNRALVMAILIAIPAAVNYRGVSSGANLSSLMTLAKLLPLALLIVFGVARFAQHPEIIRTPPRSCLTDYLAGCVPWRSFCLPLGDGRIQSFQLAKSENHAEPFPSAWAWDSSDAQRSTCCCNS